MLDAETRAFLNDLRDSLHRLDLRIQRVLGDAGTPERGCSQCGASLVGKRRDAVTCGAYACKKAARQEGAAS